MKRIIANKILLITTLALLIFASFSVVIINFINVKMMTENVAQLYEIYVEVVDDCDNMQEIQKKIDNVPGNLRVIIADANGIAIADSKRDTLSIPTMTEEKYFINALSDSPKAIITHSGVYHKDSIVYAKKFHNTGKMDTDLVLLMSMPVTYNGAYFIAIIPLFLVVVVVVLLLTSGFTSNLIKSAIAPLTMIQKNLEDINRGVYRKVEVKSKYREVERVVTEINTFSSKISNSMDYLNYEQAKIGFILDNMTQGLVAVSSKNYVVLTNRSALSILGSTKNLLGCSLSTLISNDALSEKINAAIENRRNAIFEEEIKGHHYRIEVVRIVKGNQEDQKGIDSIITFTDVTTESNSAAIRSEFFANASHELKTPLTAVKGFAELLPLARGEDAKSKCATEIMKNTDRMLALIQDMLKLSKIDANVIDEELELVDLRKMAEDVKSNIASISNSRNITLNIGGTGMVYGGRKQIEEVVTNLIDNAVKYNRDDGLVNVNIVEDDRTTTFIVEDTGIGIDIKHQSRIFERFYRVDKGRNRKVSSTGLGLAIVKHIVLQHGGTIAVSSKLGEGTKFTVVFPCAKLVAKIAY